MSGKYSLTPELKSKQLASYIFFFLCIIFAIVAIINPKWGTDFVVTEYRRGLDTVFAIDVSRSMDIFDVRQGGGSLSRLEQSIEIAKETAKAVSGGRFAAAIGRSRGYLAVPLTWDNEAALSFLDALDGSSMTGRSTNLEALIDAAADAFQSGSPARKIIVLFSDGESLGGVLANAVNRCAKEGIILTTVAVGSDAGRPVPGITENQIQETISRRDAAVMRIAAERTGGIYIDGNRDDAAFTLSSHLLTLSQETNPGSSRPAPKERRTLFIILAILCYGISKFFPLIPRLPAASVAALIIFLSSCSEGKLLLVEANYLHSQGRHDEALIPYLKALEFEDSAPYAEYGLGLTFYLIDEGDAALKRFESSRQMLGTSTEHRELRYRNNYNTGIVYFEEGDYRSAAAAFKDALRADPRRLDAKRNLELSLLSIARQTEEDNRGERKQESEMREILFDYIREEEVQHWKSKEWSQEEKYLGPDY